ncbi:MAG: AMP-binding protein, partial [Mycobacterium sp.]
MAPGASACPLLAALEEVLNGRASALLPAPSGTDQESALSALGVGASIDDDVAVVVTTSGTTGAPKGALLTAAALTASAAATHDRLGGPM